MKKILFIFCMLLTITLTNACSSDTSPSDSTLPEENLGTPIKSITDVLGTVHFNKSLQKWEIINHIPLTIDSVVIYYPINISDDFKIEGLKVFISGDVYKGDKDILLGGEEVYMIKLIKIKKA